VFGEKQLPNISHLSRADVAGGFISANVLLASLKSEPVAVLVVRIPKTIEMDCNGLKFLH
jgi:hypothetical protein